MRGPRGSPASLSCSPNRSSAAHPYRMRRAAAQRRRPISRRLAASRTGHIRRVTDLQAIADRVEIEALRGEFTDAIMTHDYDRFASLFTEDGVWRIPYIEVEHVTRANIRAAIEQMQELWHYFIQVTSPGSVDIDGDVATGRAYVTEVGQMRNGHSELNYSVYHDRYRRTADGWKFTERVYEVRYLDESAL